MSVTIPYTRRQLSTIPLEADPGQARRRRSKPGDDAPFSGTILCDLTTRTPLCIHSAYRELRDDDAPYIPGSSLRGMIRNVFEVLGASCLRLVDRPPRNAPRSVEICSPEQTCLCCRVFGFTYKKEFSWGSKVQIHDAHPFPVIDPGTRQKRSSPWKWGFANLRRQFAGQPGPSDGWVVFPCVPFDAPYSDQPRGAWPRCLAEGSVLRFRVDYINLSEEERSLLLFALTLSHGGYRLAHKVGYAKALGLGECTIQIASPTSAPPIGKSIEPYLQDKPFQEFVSARSIE